MGLCKHRQTGLPTYIVIQEIFQEKYLVSASDPEGKKTAARELHSLTLGLVGQGMCDV